MTYTRLTAAIVLVFSVFTAVLRATAREEAPAKDAARPSPSSGPLTLEQIMQDPDWIGRAPEGPVWSDDSSRVFFRRKREGSEIRDWWVVAPGAKPKKLSLKKVAREAPARGVLDRRRERKAFVFHGDLFVRDLASGSTRQLTRTEAAERAPRFLADGRHIQFRRDGSLLVRNLDTGLEFQPAIVRFDDEPDDAKPKDESFVARKESELFQYLEDQQTQKDARREHEEKSEEADRSDVGKPYYLGKENELRRQELSPDGRWLALVTAPKSSRKSGRSDKMPIWIQDDGYAVSRDVRSLVGTVAEGDESLTLLDLQRHRTLTVDLNILPGIKDDPLEFLRKTADDAKDKEAEPKARDVNIPTIEFSANSKFLLIQCYSVDNKDRWIATVRLNARKPVVRVLEHRRDPAWINWRARVAGWVGESRQVFYVSEKTGYAHLYVADAARKDSQALTSGSYEVSDVHVSRDGKRIFFRSNATHPGVYELSVVDVASGKISPLTSLGGLNDFEISPDERFAVARHSTLDRPPELVLVDLARAESPRQLTRFVSRAFTDVEWTVPQIVEVPSRHGRPVHARLYLPATDGKTPRAAVVFVHGAGYLQNAHQGWSGYFREFMFHSLLTRHGYVVLDMDYRASAGYGRDWRTAIYRRMGTPELEDIQDGVNWLVRTHQVDRQRVGVYGGSYGGFMTLMALFKEPGLFACGGALRPVTDWAHYNHPYTSNILNEPDVDPEAYERSSPIYFAEGLQDPLLMCHGMLDDNVFFKDTVRLAQKLIELQKEDWEVAIYPVEPHGFRRPSSWLDEYRRLLKLFERHLRE